MGAPAASVNQLVWLQVIAQDAQQILCDCLGAAQDIAKMPLGPQSTNVANLLASLCKVVHDKTDSRYRHGSRWGGRKKALLRA